MKTRILMVALAMAAATSVNAQLLQAGVDGSVLSFYTEQAGSPSESLQRIWGDMRNAGLDLRLSWDIWNSVANLWLGLEAAAGVNTILPAPMNLGSEDHFLTIGGWLWWFEVGPSVGWRVHEGLSVRLGVNFSRLSGLKTFTDYQESGIVQKAGTFGGYDFAMMGPLG